MGDRVGIILWSHWSQLGWRSWGKLGKDHLNCVAVHLSSMVIWCKSGLLGGVGSGRGKWNPRSRSRNRSSSRLLLLYLIFDDESGKEQWLRLRIYDMRLWIPGLMSIQNFSSSSTKWSLSIKNYRFWSPWSRDWWMWLLPRCRMCNKTW